MFVRSAFLLALNSLIVIEMTKTTALLAALICVTGLFGPMARAAETDDASVSRWAVNGFGTLGAAYHDEDDTRFRRSVDQRGGAREGQVEMRNDSVLGVQVNGVLDSRWSVMAQAVTRQDVDRKWTPQLTWAFVKYMPNDWSEFRFGRMAVDIYLDGDSRHVGYVYTTVRPYADVYGRLTFDTFDGVDGTFQRTLGPGLVRLKLFGGRTRGDIYLNDAVYALDKGRTFGATLDWVGEELSFKLSWGSMVTTRDALNDPLRLGLIGAASLLPQPVAGQALARAGEITQSNRISYLGLGVGWERGPFSLRVVGTDMSMTVYPGFEGWGLGATAAYRIGDWKPFVTYSRSILDPVERRLDLPAGAHPAIDALRAGWEEVNNYVRHDQYTAGIGVRYDFTDNAALKLQADRIEAKRSSSLLDAAGNRTDARSFTVLSATLDFVF